MEKELPKTQYNTNELLPHFFHRLHKREDLFTAQQIQLQILNLILKQT